MAINVHTWDDVIIVDLSASRRHLSLEKDAYMFYDICCKDNEEKSKYMFYNMCCKNYDLTNPYVL